MILDIDRMNARLRLDHAALADGGMAHLAAVSAHGKASILALVRDAAKTEFEIASGLFESDAIDASIEDLLPRLARGPLTDFAFNRFGVHSEGRWLVLHDRLCLLRDALGGHPGALRAFERPATPPPPDSILGMPYDFRNEGRPPPFVAAGAPRPAPPRRDGAKGNTVRITSEGLERKRIEDWLDALRDDFQPGHGLVLDESLWSPGTVAFYAPPGTSGTWRRQAARLYPAFARTIAHDPGIRDLVDRGLPFENRLLALLKKACASLNGYETASVGEGLTAAKLRRLRLYPRSVFGYGQAGYPPLLRAVAAVPLAHLPGTVPGWNRFMAYATRLLSICEAGRIPVDSAFRGIPADWELARLWDDHPGQDVPSALMGIEDMAARLADTLLAPAHGGLDRVPMAPASIAIHLLFRDDAFAVMARRQREWHRDLARMAPLLDDGRSLEWPALFEPIRAGGFEIRCLTNSGELDAEGAHGDDDIGMAGLSHCVGGYAPLCFEGLSHIASVVAVGPDGARSRVATAEIVRRGGEFMVRQIQARANAAPPREARIAIDGLVEGLNDGSLPYDERAARRRDPAAPSANPDIEKAYAAWLPHLPPSLRAADAEGFRARIRSEVARLTTPRPPVPAPRDGRAPGPGGAGAHAP